MTTPDTRQHAPIPDWPMLEIVVDAHGRGSINGKTVIAASEDAARNELLAEAARYAAVAGRPLRVKALDPRGVWHLIAHPDGAVTAVVDEPEPTRDPVEPQSGPEDADGLHLRVHPDGSITALDEPDPAAVAALGSVDPRDGTGARVPDAATRAGTDPPGHDRGDGPVPAPAWQSPDAGSTLLGEPDDRATAQADHYSLADPAGIDDELWPDAAAASVATERDGRERQGWDEAADSQDPSTAAPVDETPENRDPPVAADDPFWTAPATSDTAAGRAPADGRAAPHEEPGRGQTPERSFLDSFAPPRETPSPVGSPVDEPQQTPSAASSGTHPDERVDAGAGPVADRPPHATGLRRWWRPAAMVAAAAALIVAIAMVASGGSLRTQTTSATPTTGPNRTRTAAADATPAGVSAPPSLASPPAPLAEGAPPGFGASPVWGVPIATGSAPVVTADGRVLVLTSDHQVALVEPADGTVTWHVPAPAQATGPHVTTIDGQRVAAVVTPVALTYWPLPPLRSSTALAPATLTSAAATAPVAVDLAAGSTLSWAGTSPLVTLADGSAGVIQAGAVQRVTLPTGARPLAADGADVLAVLGRYWVRQGAGQAPAPVQQLAVPSKATGTSPTRVDTVGGSFLATVWSSPQGPVVAVYDAHTGHLDVQATFPRTVSFLHATTVRQADGERTAIGPALLDPQRQNLAILDSKFTPVALAPGHVYADDLGGALVDLQIKGSNFKIVPFHGKTPAVPIGITTVGSQTRAIVVVTSGSGRLLCGLPTS